jgi:DNA-binding NarL/FixJ family response regulator
MEKIYKVRISFGDGNPIEDSVVAKSGMLAQDLAMQLHPGARNVHLIGVENRYERFKPLPVQPILCSVAADDHIDLSSRDSLVRHCIQMHNEGKSQRAIAGQLNLAKSTVGRWIKQYG